MSLKIVPLITAYENIPMNVNAIEDNWIVWDFLVTENYDKIFNKWVNFFFQKQYFIIIILLNASYAIEIIKIPSDILL